MTRKIVAITGVSGVGKSYFVEEIKKDVNIQHLQASSLIKEGAIQKSSDYFGQDFLRENDIDINQLNLIRGFNGLKDDYVDIVLDSHTVIDTPRGYSYISPSVFKEIGVTHLVMLTDEPKNIVFKRERDSNRKRPKRNELDIFNYQKACLLHAYEISQCTEIPLIVCKVSCANSLHFLFN